MRSFVLVACLLFSACGGSDAMFTLYRSSPADDAMRIHVASFDADESASYNDENCRLAAEHFRKQAKLNVRYWCEKGPFKK
ncbi:MAG: hypothetical protein ABI409_08715 [Ramlibacter sp.]